MSYNNDQDDLGTDLGHYDVNKLRDNIESHKRLRKKRYYKYKINKGLGSGGLNSAPKDKESLTSSNFLSSHMPTVPEFNQDQHDNVHDLDYDKNLGGYFSQTSSQTKDSQQRPHFFFKQQQRMVQAKTIQERNFGNITPLLNSSL